MKISRGFTLIELLIALAIIGIVASVAYPAYRGYVETSRRASAKAAIAGIANDLESYYARNNTYVGWANLAAFSADKYALAVPPANLTAAGYVITATPSLGDAMCGTLSVDQTGRGTASTGGAGCW